MGRSSAKKVRKVPSLQYTVTFFDSSTGNVIVIVGSFPHCVALLNTDRDILNMDEGHTVLEIKRNIFILSVSGRRQKR